MVTIKKTTIFKIQSRKRAPMELLKSIIAVCATLETRDKNKIHV